MPRHTEKMLDLYMIKTLDMMNDAAKYWDVSALKKRIEEYQKGLIRLETRIRNNGGIPLNNKTCISLSDQIEVFRRSIWIKENAKRLRNSFGENPDIVSEEERRENKEKAVNEILSYVDNLPEFRQSTFSMANDDELEVAGIEISSDEASLNRSIHPRNDSDLFALIGDVAAEYDFPGIAEEYPDHTPLLEKREGRRKVTTSLEELVWNDLPDTEKKQLDPKRYEKTWQNYHWNTRFEKDPERALAQALSEKLYVDTVRTISKYPYVVEKYGSETGLLDEIYSKKTLKEKIDFDVNRAIQEEEFRKLPYSEKERLSIHAAYRYFGTLTPVEQYREDPETAIEEYIKKEAPLDEVKKVEKEFPGVVDKVWDKMRWAQKENFDKDRFETEYRQYSWSKKVEMDRGFANRWFEKLSPSEMYEESQYQAFQYYKENRLTEEQLRKVETDFPGSMDKYWDSLTLDEKRNLYKDRFDKEFAALPWDKKVQLDKTLAEEYWKKLSNPERYNENQKRAEDEFSKNPIPWEDVEKIDKEHPGYKDDYWKKLSEDVRFEHYIDELDRRTGYDPKKLQDSSVYSSITRQGRRYSDRCWQNSSIKQKFEWNPYLVSKELIQNGVKTSGLVNEGLSAKNIADYINHMSPDEKLKLAKPAFDKQFAAKQNWEEKVKYHKEEAERRFNEAKTIPDKIKVDKGHTFDTLRENKTPLSTIEKEAGVTVKEEYFSSLSAAQKRDIYTEEYDRRWNEADYNDKKKLDPERTKTEIFDPAPYEEKRKLNKDDALKYLSSLDEKERNMLHPEDALALKEKAIQEKNKANSSSKLSKETLADVENAKKYVDRALDKNGKINITAMHNPFELSKNLALADKATIEDIYNLGRIAREAVFRDDLRSKTELGKMGLGTNSQEIYTFVNELFNTSSKVIPESYGETIPETLTDEQKLSFKGKLNEDGYVVLSDQQKEKLAGFIRNLEPVEVESFSGTGLEKRISVYHNQSLSEGKTLYENNPGMRQPVETAVQNESLNAKADIEKANLNTIKEMNEAVLDLKDQYNALRSHGPAIFDSKEYSNMKTAYNNFIKAYDNVLAGKHPDGKVNDKPEGLSFEDTTELKRLKDEMSKAAETYTKAKFAQKGGGIDMHKTGQGADRLAFADALSEFKISPKVTNEISARQNEVKSKNGEIKKVSLSTLERGSKRGRGHLEFHAKRLKEREHERQAANNTDKQKKAAQM